MPDTKDLEDRISADIYRACAAFPPPRRERVGVGDRAMFLTPSEISIFRLVGLGLTNLEIAERLFVSPLTVRTHLKHIHDKCGIKNRGMLVAVSSRAFPVMVEIGRPGLNHLIRRCSRSIS